MTGDEEEAWYGLRGEDGRPSIDGEERSMADMDMSRGDEDGEWMKRFGGPPRVAGTTAAGRDPVFA